MQTSDTEPAVEPERTGFDVRLALPLVAALAIAVAGFFALRPPRPLPGDAALEGLSGDDVVALVEVASSFLPAQDLAPESLPIEREAVQGAIDAGWLQPVGAGPDWRELDLGELEHLHELVGYARMPGTR
jgi:hypothetical protein